MGLEDGEDFLCVRDDFTANHATLNLIDLALCVGHEAFDLQFCDQIKGITQSLRGDGGQCLADFVEVALSHIQIRLVGLDD